MTFIVTDLRSVKENNNKTENVNQELTTFISLNNVAKVN